MKNTEKLTNAFDEIINSTEKMLYAIKALKECLTDSDLTEETKNGAIVSSEEATLCPDANTHLYTKEEVRALLANKATESGGQYKAQVKAIVNKFANGGNLADIPAENYPDVVKEIESLM